MGVKKVLNFLKGYKNKNLRFLSIRKKRNFVLKRVWLVYNGLVSKYFKRVWCMILRVGYFEERVLKWVVLIKKGLGVFKKRWCCLFLFNLLNFVKRER